MFTVHAAWRSHEPCTLFVRHCFGTSGCWEYSAPWCVHSAIGEQWQFGRERDRDGGRRGHKILRKFKEVKIWCDNKQTNMLEGNLMWPKDFIEQNQFCWDLPTLKWDFSVQVGSFSPLVGHLQLLHTSQSWCPPAPLPPQKAQLEITMF